MCQCCFGLKRFLLLLLVAVPTATCTCLAAATLEQVRDETQVMAEFEDTYQLKRYIP